MFRWIYLLFFVNIMPMTFSQYHRRRQNHQIEWNSSNLFFENQPSVLNVRLGDTIDFLCPHANHSSSLEYNTLYLVSEIDYNLCLTNNYQVLLHCNQPYASKRLIYTLSISKYLPYPNMPEFSDGRSYYFVSTSTGERTGMNQTYDGLCRTKNLRLIVDVQKYYRRYTKQDPSQYRMRIQKQISNHTIEHLISSDSTRLSCSSAFFFFFAGSVMYLSSLLRAMISLW